MPTFTRDQGTRIKTHIFETVLGQDPDSPVEMALRKNMLDNIQGICTMQRDVIRTLNYDTVVGTNTTTTDLKAGQQGLLTSLQDFLNHVAKEKGSSLDFEEYLALTSVKNNDL